MDIPKSPKFMSKMKVHNPLSKINSLSMSPASVKRNESTVKHRTKDIAKAMRRKVVTRSFAVDDDDNEEEDTKSEKKNRTKFRNWINSVYQEKPKTSKEPICDTLLGRVFGMPLAVAVARNRVSDKLPLCRVFQESILYMEAYALQRVGIYRVPGFRAKVNELKSMYNNGEAVNLTNYDPETVGELLKLYLRELPEPLLTRQHGAKFEGILQIEDEARRIKVLCEMLRELPPEHYATLAWLCLHINHVYKCSDVNKMTITNLIIILSPTLLISNTLLRVLCENAERIFPYVKLDPDHAIPTKEEIDRVYREVPDKTSEDDQNLNIVRDDLIQSFVWEQARNNALEFVKEKLKEQIREERQLVSTYENELKQLEDQNYVLGAETVILRGNSPRRGREKTECQRQVKKQDNEEDLRLYLSTLEQENTQFEADKATLYSSLISETLSCIETYTEIRYRETYLSTESAAEA